MIAGLREYDATFSGVAATTAVDVWEVNGHASRVTWVTGIELGQTSEVGDAQEEQLLMSWIQAYSTSGSGGASVTPSPNNTDAAFGGTVERMNTTQATGGSPIPRRAIPFNVRAGYLMMWDPGKWLLVPASGRLVLTLPAAGDSVTFASTIYLAEAG